MPRFHRLEACEERPDQCERNGMEKYAHRCRVWRTTSRLKIVGRMDHLLQQPHSGQSMFCIWKKRVDPKSNRPLLVLSRWVCTSTSGRFQMVRFECECLESRSDAAKARRKDRV